MHKLIPAQFQKIRKTLENAVFSRVFYGDSSGIRTLDSLIKSQKNVIVIILKCPYLQAFSHHCAVWFSKISCTKVAQLFLAKHVGYITYGLLHLPL